MFVVVGEEAARALSALVSTARRGCYISCCSPSRRLSRHSLDILNHCSISSKRLIISLNIFGISAKQAVPVSS